MFNKDPSIAKIANRIKPINPVTLEDLIEDLDSRGLLVLLVLLGQQAMKILTEDTKHNQSSIIKSVGTIDASGI